MYPLYPLYPVFLIVSIVAAIAGITFGGAVRFNNLASSGPAIFGSVIAFAVTASLIALGGTLTWVGLAAAGFVFGVVFRGAAR